MLDLLKFLRTDSTVFYDAFFFVQRIVEHSEPVYATIRCEFTETRKVVSKVPDIRFSRLPEPVNNIRAEESQKRDAAPGAEPPGWETVRDGAHLDSGCGRGRAIPSTTVICQGAYDHPCSRER